MKCADEFSNHDPRLQGLPNPQDLEWREGAAPEFPGDYLFVVNGAVKYCGTSNGKRKVAARLRDYRGKSDKGTRRLTALIRQTLEADRRVRIYAKQATYRTVPVLGKVRLNVEQAVLQRYNPPWNLVGVEHADAKAMWSNAARLAVASRRVAA